MSSLLLYSRNFKDFNLLFAIQQWASEDGDRISIPIKLDNTRKRKVRFVDKDKVGYYNEHRS